MKAKYSGTCTECSTSIEKGEEIDFDSDKRAIHERCKTSSDFQNDGRAHVRMTSAGEEVTWRQSGKRTPPRCDECNMQHNGECF